MSALSGREFGILEMEGNVEGSFLEEHTRLSPQELKQ
jgi:hypothetical protein